jgi:Lrp/AsnC family transcriptional regulator, leucine-responsive regulatory protein
VIARQIAVVDPALAGRPLQMVLTIKVEREGPANIPGLVDQLSRHDAVTHFFHVTGEPDYVAILSVRSMAEYEDFVTGVLDAWPHFATRTLVVIKALKSGFEIATE